MADASSRKLREELRRSGLSAAVIDAAWPSWWSEESSASPSARAELRFALARKLGLAPKPLMGERVEFVWKDRARFKHLGAETQADLEALSSFAVSMGRMLVSGAPQGRGLSGLRAEDLRTSILKSSPYVDLRTLAEACWALGVPVVHLRVFPLPVKAMHAMVVGEGAVGAIMLGRDAPYPAQAAFTLAHEMAHLALGHARPGHALVDLEDPALAGDRDEEERQADEYALALLTGSSNPEITTELGSYNAPTLAESVLRAGPYHRIEPGTLALCVGYRQRNWPVVMSALRFIYSGRVQLWKAVNALARSEMDWTKLASDDLDYVGSVLKLEDA